jgi:putative lipoprotein
LIALSRDEEESPMSYRISATLGCGLLLLGLGACSRNDDAAREEEAARRRIVEGMASVEVARELTGEYSASLPGASSLGREVTLRLGLDGTSEMRQDGFDDQPQVPAAGRWEAPAPDQARVLLARQDGSEDTLLFQHSGFSLIATEFDQAKWGTSKLVLLSRQAPAPQVRGTLSYRERMALTEAAVVDVALEDVSRADAPAEIVARQVIRAPGQVPIAFALRYDPAWIDPRHTYAVRARIMDGGQLRFTTTESLPVLTQGHPSELTIELKRAGAP